MFQFNLMQVMSVIRFWKPVEISPKQFKWRYQDRQELWTFMEAVTIEERVHGKPFWELSSSSSIHENNGTEKGPIRGTTKRTQPINKPNNRVDRDKRRMLPRSDKAVRFMANVESPRDAFTGEERQLRALGWIRTGQGHWHDKLTRRTFTLEQAIQLSQERMTKKVTD